MLQGEIEGCTEIHKHSLRGILDFCVSLPLQWYMHVWSARCLPCLTVLTVSFTFVPCWFYHSVAFLMLHWRQMGQVPFLSINTPTLLNKIQDKNGVKLTMNAKHFSPPPVPSALCCSFHPSSVRYAYQHKRIIVHKSKPCLITENYRRP